MPTASLLSASAALDIPNWVEISAIAFGALAGALTGVRVHFDIAGVMFLAVSCGLGGGVIRDVLLQEGTPIALTDRWYLPTSLAAGLIGIVLGRMTEAAKNRFGLTFVLVDAVCLSAFALLGADRAVAAELPVVSCVLVGVVTGTGGAIIRDIVVNEPPELFLPGSFYAFAAAGGCIIYVIGLRSDIPSVPLAVVCFAAVIGIRVLSTHRRWRTTSADALDLSHRVARIRRPPRG
ncbi:trimeric intracellular cation channel family protein [Desertimonas flava]|uniref:trimeric intracellular cation channel family protein n=1 Tax=Desertimonas flava TaxID=2064846 RepID=UPI000E354C1E|nr:TRIC cation channel family protein [Desertimonas flava]